MKNIRFKKYIVIMTAAVLMMTAVAGCSSSTEETSGTFYSTEGTSISEQETSAETETSESAVSSEVTETTNTEVKFDNTLIVAIDADPSEALNGGDNSTYPDEIKTLYEDYSAQSYTISNLFEDYKNGVGIGFEYDGSVYMFINGFRASASNDNVLVAKIDDDIWNAYVSSINKDEYARTVEGTVTAYDMHNPADYSMQLRHIEYDSSTGVFTDHYVLSSIGAEG